MSLGPDHVRLCQPGKESDLTDEMENHQRGLSKKRFMFCKNMVWLLFGEWSEEDQMKQ